LLILTVYSIFVPINNEIPLIMKIIYLALTILPVIEIIVIMRPDYISMTRLYYKIDRRIRDTDKPRLVIGFLALVVLLYQKALLFLSYSLIEYIPKLLAKEAFSWVLFVFLAGILATLEFTRKKISGSRSKLPYGGGFIDHATCSYAYPSVIIKHLMVTGIAFMLMVVFSLFGWRLFTQIAAMIALTSIEIGIFKRA